MGARAREKQVVGVKKFERALYWLARKLSAQLTNEELGLEIDLGPSSTGTLDDRVQGRTQLLSHSEIGPRLAQYPTSNRRGDARSPLALHDRSNAGK